MHRHKQDQVFEELIDRLFKSVGKETPKPEDYSKLPDGWQSEKLWTRDDYNKFQAEAVQYVRAKLRFTERQAKWNVGLFLLNYGWGFKDGWTS